MMTDPTPPGAAVTSWSSGRGGRVRVLHPRGADYAAARWRYASAVLTAAAAGTLAADWRGDVADAHSGLPAAVRVAEAAAVAELIGRPRALWEPGAATAAGQPWRSALAAWRADFCEEIGGYYSAAGHDPLTRFEAAQVSIDAVAQMYARVEAAGGPDYWRR